MQIRNTLLLAASAALAVAEDVILAIKSDNSDVDGNSIGFKHEGAGINYGFLGTGGSTSPLTYDESTQSISDPNAGFSFAIPFGVSGGYVQVSVVSPEAEFSFDGNTLLANGTADVFYACKNVNDPYRYSEKQYALMYYKSNAPSDCIPVNIVKVDSTEPSASASWTTAKSSSAEPSSTLESSSAGPSTTSEISSYTGAGFTVAPAGAFAAVAGIAAALI